MLVILHVTRRVFPRAISCKAMAKAAAIAAAVIAVAMTAAPRFRRALPASRAIANRVVCLDAGHGGVDPGAVGYAGAIEKDINLAIARLLGGYLRSAGAKVVLTREGDEDLADLMKPPLSRKVDDLDLRIEKAVSSGSDVFISIHCNKYPSPSEYGAQTFYVARGNPDSRRLAETIQAELVRVTGKTWRDALGDSEQYVLREMQIPAVTVEAGFLSNPEDENLLMQPEYQSQVAWAIFLGILRFFSEGVSA